VHLKPLLGEIKTDRGNRHGGRLLSFVAFTDDHVLAHRCRERGPSTPSMLMQVAADLCGTEQTAAIMAIATQQNFATPLSRHRDRSLAPLIASVISTSREHRTSSFRVLDGATRLGPSSRMLPGTD
jgi:hypothetical protein